MSFEKLFALIISIWIHVVIIEARDKPADASRYKQFDEAQKNAAQNMCPYLIQGSKRIPVVCWMCHFPHGMHSSNQYVYECCPGYVRSEMIDNKCVGVEPTWMNIVDYLKSRGHNQTAEALAMNTGISELAAGTSPKAYTVFVPNEDGDIKNSQVDYTKGQDSARMLVTNGRRYSNQFVNGRTIRNENGVDLKVTTYSNGLSFIECRLIMSADHETTSGVVHFLDGALPPTNRYPTVMSRLTMEPDLSRFVQAIPQDLRQALERQGAWTWYTVLAPTNKAWSEAVQNLQPGESISNLARNHILPKMICSGAIIRKSEPVGPTEAQDYIRFALNAQGEPVVLDSCNTEIPIIRRDLMSGNGVVHVVDKAIVSTAALALSDALSCIARNPESGLSRGIKEMQDCGLPSRSKANIVLIPHDDAYKWLSADKENSAKQARMRTDNNYRCGLYAYHLLTSNTRSSRWSPQRGLAQGQRLKTDYIAPNGHSTFVQSYHVKERDGSKLIFNGAFTNNNKNPIKFRDGIIYPVKTINFPPEKAIMDVLRGETDLSVTMRKADMFGLDKDLKQMNGKVLFLAPMNMGWESRDVENSYTPGQMRKLFQLHTIPLVLFGGENGIVWHSTIQTVNSMLTDRRGEKIRLIIKRGPDGNTFIGHSELSEDLWAMVIHWNLIGTDGIVWIIDWPIKCPDLECS